MNRRNPSLLAGVLAIQSVGTVFFMSDALRDTLSEGVSTYIFVEFVIALALVLGLFVGASALKRTLAEMDAGRRALRVASGALAEVIDAQFRDWGLTAAETDVAFLALKGLDVAEIAELRQTAAGTIRAQLSRVYAKAGIAGRAQFAALFVEDILGDGVIPAVPQPNLAQAVAIR